MTELDHAGVVAAGAVQETSGEHCVQFAFAIERDKIIEAANRRVVDDDLRNRDATGALGHLAAIETDIDLIDLLAAFSKKTLRANAVWTSLGRIHLDVCHVLYRTCMDAPALETVSTRIAAIRTACVDAAAVGGRSAHDVTLLAATKYVDASVITMLVTAGIDGVAENRLESLTDKQSELPQLERDTWHYIGRLQSRKAVEIAQRVGAIHTLCSASAARRLDAWIQQQQQLVLPRLLVQVNAADDPSKDGLTHDMVDAFLDDLPQNISVDGFMTMPAFAEDPELSRDAFSRLRELRDEMQQRYAGRHPLRCLSMGTSQDWQVAVEEGATHVRLGRVLFT